MGLFIVADTSALSEAVSYLGAGAAGITASSDVPSLDDPDTDTALSGFHSMVQNHAAALSASAAQASASLGTYLIGFKEVGS